MLMAVGRAADCASAARPASVCDLVLLPPFFNGAARLQYLIRRPENLLRRLLGYGVNALLHPVLDVAAAELRARQVQRLAANERDALGLYFPERARRRLAVVEVGFCGVA